MENTSAPTVTDTRPRGVQPFTFVVGTSGGNTIHVGGEAWSEIQHGQYVCFADTLDPALKGRFKGTGDTQTAAILDHLRKRFCD